LFPLSTWARVACLPFLAWVFALFWYYPKSFAPKRNPASFNLCSSLQNFRWHSPIHHTISLLLQAETHPDATNPHVFEGAGIQF
jgi:hypothetical protein